MKITTNLKKYDLITLTVLGGTIKNCLINNITECGIHIYPIENHIKGNLKSNVIARIFVPEEKILGIKNENPNLLFYALNVKHDFVRDAIKYHMNNEKRSRKNQENNI